MPRVRIDELIKERQRKRPATNYHTVARAVFRGRGITTDEGMYHALWKLNSGRMSKVDAAELLLIARHFRQYDIRKLLDAGNRPPKAKHDDDGA